MSLANSPNGRSGERPFRRLTPALALLGLFAALLAGIPFRQGGGGEPGEVALETRPARVRAVFGHVPEKGEDMGLLGVHYDLLAPFESLPGVYAGAGIYGAVSGEHGGLLAGGGTLGWLREIGRGLALDLGVFAGGGGDGEAAAGLLLRPHAALEIPAGPIALRLEAAHVDFGQGDVGGTHLAFGASLPTQLVTARRSARGEGGGAGELVERRLRITPAAMWIDPEDGTERRNGSPLDDVVLGGIELDVFLSDWLYVPVQAYGAGGGDVAGYAMVLGGLGASPAIVRDRLHLEARVSAGSGGGGGVDTGGGFLWQAEAGLSARLTDALALQVLGGRIEAPDGDFEGELVQAGLSWTPTLASPAGARPRRGATVPADEVGVADLRLTAAHRTYFPRSGARTKGGDDLDAMHLLGAAVEKPVAPALALAARGFGTYAGDAEGYAEAWGGLVVRAAPWHADHELGLRGEVGVGGAGGVDVGSGLLYGASAFYRYAATDDLGVQVELGRVESDRGPFSADAIVVGLTWDVGLPVR